MTKLALLGCFGWSILRNVFDRFPDISSTNTSCLSGKNKQLQPSKGDVWKAQKHELEEGNLSFDFDGRLMVLSILLSQAFEKVPIL